jgi:hypothetical protein
LQSGDDTSLKNIWEEISVQVQDQQSVMWDAYMGTIHALILSKVAGLDAATKQTIWLQTEQGNAEKILLDGRNVKGKPQDMERFHYSVFAARETHRIVVEHNLVSRFAYVVHEPLRDRERLGETVAVNRGMDVKVFEILEDAIEWLTGAR